MSRNRASGIEHPATYVPLRHFDFCRESSTNRHFSCKTNPICTNLRISLTSFLVEAYTKNAKFSLPKANPSKPKQSQSHPRFSPVIAPQSQNKPKQTQSKPNFRLGATGPFTTHHSLLPGRAAHEVHEGFEDVSGAVWAGGGLGVFRVRPPQGQPAESIPAPLRWQVQQIWRPSPCGRRFQARV